MSEDQGTEEREHCVGPSGPYCTGLYEAFETDRPIRGFHRFKGVVLFDQVGETQRVRFCPYCGGSLDRTALSAETARCVQALRARADRWHQRAMESFGCMDHLGPLTVDHALHKSIASGASLVSEELNRLANAFEAGDTDGL